MPKSILKNFSCNNNELATLIGIPIEVGGNLICGRNNFSESEIFLYNYTSEQIRSYYENKNLSEKLVDGLSEEAGVGIKKKKI